MASTSSQSRAAALNAALATVNANIQAGNAKVISSSGGGGSSTPAPSTPSAQPSTTSNQLPSTFTTKTTTYTGGTPTNYYGSGGSNVLVQAATQKGLITQTPFVYTPPSPKGITVPSTYTVAGKTYTSSGGGGSSTPAPSTIAQSVIQSSKAGTSVAPSTMPTTISGTKQDVAYYNQVTNPPSAKGLIERNIQQQQYNLAGSQMKAGYSVSKIQEDLNKQVQLGQQRTGLVQQMNVILQGTKPQILKPDEVMSGSNYIVGEGASAKTVFISDKDINRFNQLKEQYEKTKAPITDITKLPSYEGFVKSGGVLSTSATPTLQAAAEKKGYIQPSPFIQGQGKSDKNNLVISFPELAARAAAIAEQEKKLKANILVERVTAGTPLYGGSMAIVEGTKAKTEGIKTSILQPSSKFISQQMIKYEQPLTKAGTEVLAATSVYAPQLYQPVSGIAYTAKGMYKGIEKHPIKAAGALTLGAVTGGAGKIVTFISTGTKAAKGVEYGMKGAGVAMTGIYAGQKGMEIYGEKGRKARYEKFGEALSTEILPFGIGAAAGNLAIKEVNLKPERKVLSMQDVLVVKGEKGISKIASTADILNIQRTELRLGGRGGIKLAPTKTFTSQEKIIVRGTGGAERVQGGKTTIREGVKGLPEEMIKITKAGETTYVYSPSPLQTAVAKGEIKLSTKNLGKDISGRQLSVIEPTRGALMTTEGKILLGGKVTEKRIEIGEFYKEAKSNILAKYSSEKQNIQRTFSGEERAKRLAELEYKKENVLNALTKDLKETLSHEYIHSKQPLTLKQIETLLRIPYRLQPSEIMAYGLEKPLAKTITEPTTRVIQGKPTVSKGIRETEYVTQEGKATIVGTAFPKEYAQFISESTGYGGGKFEFITESGRKGTFTTETPTQQMGEKTVGVSKVSGKKGTTYVEQQIEKFGEEVSPLTIQGETLKAEYFKGVGISREPQGAYGANIKVISRVKEPTSASFSGGRQQQITQQKPATEIIFTEKELSAGLKVGLRTPSVKQPSINILSPKAYSEAVQEVIKSPERISVAGIAQPQGAEAKEGYTVAGYYNPFTKTISVTSDKYLAHEIGHGETWNIKQNVMTTGTKQEKDKLQKEAEAALKEIYKGQVPYSGQSDIIAEGLAIGKTGSIMQPIKGVSPLKDVQGTMPFTLEKIGQQQKEFYDMLKSGGYGGTMGKVTKVEHVNVIDETILNEGVTGGGGNLLITTPTIVQPKPIREIPKPITIERLGQGSSGRGYVPEEITTVGREDIKQIQRVQPAEIQIQKQRQEQTQKQIQDQINQLTNPPSPEGFRTGLDILAPPIPPPGGWGGGSEGFGRRTGTGIKRESAYTASLGAAFFQARPLELTEKQLKSLNKEIFTAETRPVIAIKQPSRKKIHL